MSAFQKLILVAFVLTCTKWVVSGNVASDDIGEEDKPGDNHGKCEKLAFKVNEIEIEIYMTETTKLSYSITNGKIHQKASMTLKSSAYSPSSSSSFDGALTTSDSKEQLYELGAVPVYLPPEFSPTFYTIISLLIIDDDSEANVSSYCFLKDDFPFFESVASYLGFDFKPFCCGFICCSISNAYCYPETQNGFNCSVTYQTKTCSFSSEHDR